jgi:hypothetical protein
VGDTPVPPSDTPLMAGEQEHFLAHMAAMHATRGAPTTGGLLAAIPRGSSCPPPQAAYFRAPQAVADDGAVGHRRRMGDSRTLCHLADARRRACVLP